MKTSKFIMWIAFMIFLMLNTLNAQSDFSDEIIVYIKDGIQKGANNKVEKVISSNLNSVFSKYNILQEKIISAFPEFNASDTIKISSEGEIIKLPNMSNI